VVYNKNERVVKGHGTREGGRVDSVRFFLHATPRPRAQRYRCRCCRCMHTPFPQHPPPTPPPTHPNKQQASGESFSTVVKAGTLTVSGDPPAIAVRFWGAM
jgi:hypothetical protein